MSFVPGIPLLHTIGKAARRSFCTPSPPALPLARSIVCLDCPPSATRTSMMTRATSSTTATTTTTTTATTARRRAPGLGPDIVPYSAKLGPRTFPTLGPIFGGKIRSFHLVDGKSPRRPTSFRALATVAELKKRLQELGVDSSSCLEKADLMELLEKAESQQRQSVPPSGSTASRSNYNNNNNSRSSSSNSNNSSSKSSSNSSNTSNKDNGLDGSIVVRKDKDLEAYLDGPKAVFICWHATWCPRSKLILPEFKKLANKFESAHFLAIDVDVMKDAAERHGAERYGILLPTFHAWYNGDRLGERKGADPDALKGFILSKLRMVEEANRRPHT